MERLVVAFNGKLINAPNVANEAVNEDANKLLTKSRVAEEGRADGSVSRYRFVSSLQ